MRIMFSGGGSGGSVSPLLAAYEAIRTAEPAVEAAWIGTSRGPERPLVESYGIRYHAISAGKFRRYFSILNLIDPLRVMAGFFQSLVLLRRYRPDILLTSGSFVSVPAAAAARLLHIPVCAHQQDIVPGLANKLIARIADVVTVTFEQQQEQFPFAKVRYTGNPVRSRVLSGSAAAGARFTGLDADVPTLLVLGGGQGASGINQLVLESIVSLCERMNVIHVTGAGKDISARFPDYYDQMQRHLISQRYRAYPFLTDELPDVLAMARMAVTRAGMSTLSELAALGVPMVIVPMPDSHQEENARLFSRRNAARVLGERELTAQLFAAELLELAGNPGDLQQLSQNAKALMPPGASERYATLVRDLISMRARA